MKCILKYFNVLTIIFLVTGSLYSTEYWLRQQSPTTKWLFKCSFADSLNGWAVGDSGIIIRTSNGGVNWIIQSSQSNFFIHSVSFVNNSRGWCVANNLFNFSGSKILSTSNGGLNWNISSFPDTSIELYAIHFLDSFNGWVGGSGGRVFQTTNGGTSWILRQTDTTSCSGLPIFSFAFYNSRLAYACGGAIDYAGVAWRTTNFGNLWRSQCVGPEPVYDIFIFDSLNAIGSGGDFEFGVSIQKTTNNGTNWHYNTIGIFGKGEAISFRTRAEGWIATGFSSRFAFTVDSCRTWNEIFAPDTSSIYDIVFTDPYHGWAVGFNGVILKYNTAVIGIENGNMNLPSEYILHQNYPNPFNASSKFKFAVGIPSGQISRLSDVKLVVYDILGSEVTILVNEKLEPGTYEIVFDGTNYPSGVYFYVLETDGFKQSRKMVLVK
ncbi:MAG: YCF48-related protein [Ignavibacteria bacterium]